MTKAAVLAVNAKYSARTPLSHGRCSIAPLYIAAGVVVGGGGFSAALLSSSADQICTERLHST